MAKRALLLALLVGAVSFLGFWAYGLFDLDEGFYAAVVGEMNRRGEWITPFYNGSPWFEKPILLYWLAKPTVMLFGTALGPRLPSVLASIGTLCLVGWIGKRKLGENGAIAAVLVLSASLFFSAAGRLMIVDPVLVLCLSAAFFTFYLSLYEDPRWRLVTALSLGFSVLAKGPVGLLLFAALAGTTYWREPLLRPKFKGQWLAGTALMLLVIASWYLPAYMANHAQFVQKFLIEQNLDRFTGGDEAHQIGAIGLLMYPLVLAVGMFPWSLWTRRAAKLDEWPEDQQPFVRYLWRWVLVVLIFFTISGTKLPHYVLPCTPPLALLLGGTLARRSTDRRALFAWLAAAVLIVGALVHSGLTWWYGASGKAELDRLALYVKAQPGAKTISAFQMPRRQKSLGTGKLKIQETSQPSLAFVLDQPLLLTENLDELLALHQPVWIITRQGRITTDDVGLARGSGMALEDSTPPGDYSNFRLFRLLPITKREN
ncbi:MAG: glycosyltransferase family 39 protein [Armatimonadetes bacterium]|nr:glycosyltransferase family 39 protein [Armatimonadota bacterium]